MYRKRRHIFECTANRWKDTQDMQECQQRKRFNISFHISSRDDLLNTSAVVRIQINPEDTQSGLIDILNRVRNALSSERIGIARDEDIVLQAWTSQQQWGSLRTSLHQLNDSHVDPINQSSDFDVHLRICRTELHHLLEDHLPPATQAKSDVLRG